jgi:hypothetical protein
MAARKGQLSRRQYAAHRGVSRQMVDKYVAAGVIPVRSGLINPLKADAALAKRSIAAGPGVSLAEARRRKLAASVALLVDEVEQLEASAVPPAEFAEYWSAVGSVIRQRFEEMSTQVVLQVAGRPAAEAFAVLTETVREVLTDLAGTEVVAVDADGNERKPNRRRPVPHLPNTIGGS